MGDSTDVEKMERLKQNLQFLRICTGWTASEFGFRLGVSRQTIHTFERNQKYMLTKMNYLAIRKVFDDEVKGSGQDGEILEILLDCLVDRPEQYSKSETDEIRLNSGLLAASMMKDPSKRGRAAKLFKSSLLMSGIEIGDALGSFLSGQSAEP